MKAKHYEKIGETVCATRLPNGLQLYVVPRPAYAKQFAFFATNYGGNDLNYQWDGQKREVPAGTAHFLEHKLFDTADGGADLQLAAKGAISNAFTSPSMTAYFFECTEHFYENLDILLRFVLEPYFTTASVQKEQGIIGQEIEMGADDPDTQVYYQLIECLYQNHPIKDRVIGTAESIAQLTPECLYACHEAFYHLDNMVLCVAGDVSPEEVEKHATQVTQKKGTFLHEAYPKEPRLPLRRRAETEMEVSAPQFLLGFKGPAETKDPLLEEIQAELALAMLCGKSSALYASLYEQGLIDKQFGYGFERYPGCSYYVLGGESKDPDAVVRAIAERRKEILKEGLDEAAFERLKKASFGKRVQGLDSMETVCYSLAKGHFQRVDVLSFPEVYQKVTAVSIEQVLQSAFAPEGSALSVVVPTGRKGKE
ncbi:MAG: EF-P 5-aminopentanol modification-associated protein YfmH [Oscillospiraceae bacterium]|jgi:predicted Zn-dependent peptidase